MRKRTPLAICLSLFLCSTVQAVEPERLYVTENVAETAVQRLSGRGITLPGARASVAAYDAHGREVVWREDHRVPDEAGGTHVFYRQYLVGDGVEAEIVGSDVGLHYDADGRLEFVNGTQYEDVMVTNRLEIDAIAAAERARRSTRAFARRITIEEAAAFSDPEVLVRKDAERAKIEVQNVDGQLRYVWRVLVSNPEHAAHDVVLDAQNERVIRAYDPDRHNNCFPDSQTSVTAAGVPVRPGIATRTLGATATNSWSPREPRPGYGVSGYFTHEGFWPAGPLLAVHQSLSAPVTQNELLAWQCIDPYTSEQMGYTLMPLNAQNGVPTYDDYGIFHGRAGGDALHHTRQTMLAFSTMGWNSWNNAGANATVVIDSYNMPGNQAAFRPTPRNAWDPPGASVGLGPGVNYYNPAAALDVIAHEWGHGVTYTHPNFPRTNGNTVADQLDEGFADVIGNIVEKLRQPLGYGVEQSSDWTMHEDVSGPDLEFSGRLAYNRGAQDDGTLGHIWYGPNGYVPPGRIQDRIHFNDPEYSPATAPHTTGNILVMAMRLIAEGGRNPLCVRNPRPPNITCVSFTGLGIAKARKIMWNTLPNITSTATWLDVANAAIRAAHQQYRNCSTSYNAATEQEAVRAAFIAVGITPTQATNYNCF